VSIYSDLFNAATIEMGAVVTSQMSAEAVRRLLAKVARAIRRENTARLKWRRRTVNSHPASSCRRSKGFAKTWECEPDDR
jgi:hypothetical protein